MMGVKLTIEEANKIREMHAEGYNDTEIAAELDATERTIKNHRRKMLLPGLPRHCRKRVAELLERGLLDKEIAEILSQTRPISSVQVGKIRRSLGKKVIKRGLSGAQRRKKDQGAGKYRPRQLKSDKEIAALYAGLSYA